MLRRSSWCWVPAGIAVVLVANLAWVWVRYDLLMVQRQVVAMLMPASLVLWLLMWATGLLLVARVRLASALTFAATLLYLLAANGLVSSSLLRTLEAPYLAAGPAPATDAPFDLLVVHGGGLSIAQGQRLQFNACGDRVALAGRLFHTGRAARILVVGGTGQVFAGDNALSAAEATARVLQELGVPRERIVLGDAETTSQEIRVARQIADELQAQRVGLVSSAWHLPRVMRLARAAQLAAVPVPCDFRSAPSDLWPSWWLPSGGALDGTSLAAKEYLAGVVGR